MPEQLQTTRKIPLYRSRFDEFSSQVEVTEKFRGTGQDAISELERKLEGKNGSFYSRILLVHEIEKLVVNEKIKATETRDMEVEEAAFKATELCLNLATPIYYEDPNALALLHKLEEFIRNSNLDKILEKSIVEEPDPAIMPEHSGRDDSMKAQDLLKLTNGASILGIGIGIRGWRREFDQFLDYKSQSDTPDSLFWPLRCSFHYGDLFPRLSEIESQHLSNTTNGRKIVVFCPADIFYVNFGGKRKTLNRLRLSSDYLSRIVFGTEKRPAEVFPISVTLAQSEPKSVNRHR